MQKDNNESVNINFSDYFIEVACGVNNRNHFIKLNDLEKWRKEQKDDKELYTSLFQYPTDDPNLGEIIADFLMDFDSIENPERARKEALLIAKNLINEYGIKEEDVSIAFSGNKGFHICVNKNVFGLKPDYWLPRIFKNMAEELIKKHGLKTLDLKIYDRRRLIRLINSKHRETGLYKIPLSLIELENLNIDKIKALAIKPREFILKPLGVFSKKAAAWFESHKTSFYTQLNEKKERFELIDLAEIEVLPCVKKRLEIGAKEGERNICAWQLATYFYTKGVNYEECLNLMREWYNRVDKGIHPFSWNECENAIKTVYEKGVYRVGCGSEAFEPFCVGKENCPLFNKSVAQKSFDEKKKGVEIVESAGIATPDLIIEEVILDYDENGNEKRGFLVYDRKTGELREEEVITNNNIILKPHECKELKLPETIDTIEKSEVVFSGGDLWDIMPPWEKTPPEIEEWWIYNEIRLFLECYLDLINEEEYDVLASFIMATWRIEDFETVPYLYFYGKQSSGKSRALECLYALCHRAINAKNITKSALFRIIEAITPTVLVDEAQAYKKDEEMRSVFNGGYRRGGSILLTEETAEGRKIKEFKVFGFKAFAGTEELDETIMSRCLIINMTKNIRNVDLVINEKWAKWLRRDLLRYRLKNVLRYSYTKMEKLADYLGDSRLAELFYPLLIVAPMDRKLFLLKYALKIAEKRRQRERYSLDALVFEAVMEIKKEVENNGEKCGLIPIKDITQRVNDGLSEKEEITPQKIGFVLNRLGFEKIRDRKGRFIILNEEVIKRNWFLIETRERKAGVTEEEVLKELSQKTPLTRKKTLKAMKEEFKKGSIETVKVLLKPLKETESVTSLKLVTNSSRDFKLKCDEVSSVSRRCIWGIEDKIKNNNKNRGEGGMHFCNSSHSTPCHTPLSNGNGEKAQNELISLKKAQNETFLKNDGKRDELMTTFKLITSSMDKSIYGQESMDMKQTISSMDSSKSMDTRGSMDTQLKLIKAFLESQTVKEPEAFVSKKELYKAYKTFVGDKTLNKIQFGRILIKEFGLSSFRKRIDKDRICVWKGIKLKPIQPSQPNQLTQLIQSPKQVELAESKPISSIEQKPELTEVSSVQLNQTREKPAIKKVFRRIRCGEEFAALEEFQKNHKCPGFIKKKGLALNKGLEDDEEDEDDKELFKGLEDYKPPTLPPTSNIPPPQQFKPIHGHLLPNPIEKIEKSLD
ncbi:MAG: hypothetical protein QXP78_03230, partial [Candidatus Bathyarchaeia archaeon]